jgi:hypothetical protein
VENRVIDEEFAAGLRVNPVCRPVSSAGAALNISESCRWAFLCAAADGLCRSLFKVIEEHDVAARVADS